MRTTTPLNPFRTALSGYFGPGLPPHVKRPYKKPVIISVVPSETKMQLSEDLVVALEQVNAHLRAVDTEIEIVQFRTKEAINHNKTSDSSSALKWAHTAYKERRERSQVFGPDLFGEPSWDILLDLFIANLEGKRTKTSSACFASNASSTTALRHLRLLEREGLITRCACDKDARFVYIELTSDGLDKMYRLQRKFTSMK